MMFSVGLSLRLDDFRRVASRPGVVAWGLGLQIVALPAMSFALSFALAPVASLALGMMVVAACPSGNSSNVLTQIARGDVALSVTLTAIASALAAMTTPLNIVLWSALRADTRDLVRDVGIDAGAFLLETALTLGLPLALGLFAAESRYRWVGPARRPLYSLSVLLLVLFIGGAFVANGAALASVGATLLPILVVQDSAALALGYAGGRLARLPEPACRTLAIETGIRNVGLGLVILLGQFSGASGATLVAAGWGVWHLVSGGALAAWWSRRPPALA
jgi:BASS family bile acid:Na+ symporter